MTSAVAALSPELDRGPVFEKYGAPKDVAKRFVERVAKLLEGDFGR